MTKTGDNTIKIMNIDKVLRSDLINKSALARALFPANSENTARQRLSQKVSERNGQRLTFQDKEQIKLILQDLLK